jgi:hypothetical protein
MEISKQISKRNRKSAILSFAAIFSQALFFEAKKSVSKPTQISQLPLIFLNNIPTNL